MTLGLARETARRWPQAIDDRWEIPLFLGQDSDLFLERIGHRQSSSGAGGPIAERQLGCERFLGMHGPIRIVQHSVRHGDKIGLPVLQNVSAYCGRRIAPTAMVGTPEPARTCAASGT